MNCQDYKLLGQAIGLDLVKSSKINFKNYKSELVKAHSEFQININYTDRGMQPIFVDHQEHYARAFQSGLDRIFGK